MPHQGRYKHLGVHLPCLQLRGEVEVALLGPSERRRQGCRCRPSKRWPGADVSRCFDLCELCARGTAGGPSRWAWLVCDDCKVLVKRSDDLRLAFLPIGRHSIMNQRRVDAVADERAQRAQMSSLVQGLAGWDELRRWGRLEARRLADAFGSVDEVPFMEWQRAHPPGPAASGHAAARLLAWLDQRDG